MKDFSLAKEIAEILYQAYPGHAWAVNVSGGTVQIKNLLISDRWCMVIHQDKITDANVRKVKVVRAGGEFLERCHLKRGALQEYVFEGVNKWKPNA